MYGILPLAAFIHYQGMKNTTPNVKLSKQSPKQGNADT